MTYTIKKGQRLEDILPEMPKSDRANGTKKLNAMKYLGKIKFDKDPLEIQKEMRDEWE